MVRVAALTVCYDGCTTTYFAASILSRQDHNGRSDWHVETENTREPCVTVSDPDWREYCLTPLEAIAAAEKCVRDENS